MCSTFPTFRPGLVQTASSVVISNRVGMLALVRRYSYTSVRSAISEKQGFGPESYNIFSI